MENLALFPNEAAHSPERNTGRDEMNLAEFPLVLLSDRVPVELKGKKTIRYEYPHGALTVTGSDAFGLPTAGDADVLVGLIQLTRKKNNFTDPKVHFTRYELLKVLRWPDEGKYYRRLEESLNRWSGVTLFYDNTWWDNRAKKHLTAKLHVIESIVIDESPRASGKQQTLPFSYFVWNKTFIESCQADNLKRLDLDTYFGLRSAISKRIYRFLDKRFYNHHNEWEFDLKQFAFEYIGLSRSYSKNAGKIKEKLQTAITELEEMGFIEPALKEQRYTKQGRDWRIKISRWRGPQTASEATMAREKMSAENLPSSDHPLGRLLTERGVTVRTTTELIRDFPADRIEAKIDLLDWLEQHKSGHVKEPGAWLVRAIRDDYAPPIGYKSKAEREARQKEAEQARCHAEQERRNAAEEKRRKKEQDDAVQAYWSRLSPEAQAALDTQAQGANPTDASILNSPLRKSYLKSVREAYIRSLLFGSSAD